MKETLEQALIKLIEQIERAGVFALDQLPLFVTELLTYYTFHHAIWLTVGVMFLIPLFRVLRLKRSGGNWLFDEDGDSVDSEITAWCLTASSISFLIGTIMVINNLLSLIKVVVAPRLYLIEKITTLV